MLKLYQQSRKDNLINNLINDWRITMTKTIEINSALFLKPTLGVDGMQYLQIPPVKYLGEVLDELPENCLFDKQLTGVGATTIAINSRFPTVIAVPRINMIKNKCEQHPNLLGVYGTMTADEIRNVVKSGDYTKIMVTYDSLPKVLAALGSSSSDYRLVIDEVHVLIKESGSFRATQSNRLAEIIKHFKSVCFLTATPTSLKWLPGFLSQYPVLKLRVEGATQANIKLNHVTKPLPKEVLSLILETLDIGMTPFVYVNSVSMVASLAKLLIKTRGLGPSDIKVICSDNLHNANRLSALIGKGFKAEIFAKKGEQEKSVVFLTRTSFEGSDSYCPNARTIIVSDARNLHLQHTKLDIATDIPQIIGRQRNLLDSCKDENYMLYTTELDITSLTETEYHQKLLNDAADFTKTRENLGYVTKAVRKAWEEHYMSMEDEDNMVVLNPLAVSSQMSLYESLHNTYYTNNGVEKVTQVVSMFGLGTECFKNPTLLAADLNCIRKSPNYSKSLEAYTQAVEDGDTALAKKIRNQCPPVIEIFNTVGATRIKAYGYNWTNINKLYAAEVGLSSLAATDLNLTVGSWYSLGELKGILCAVCSKKGVVGKPKAIDIKEWYGVTKSQRNKVWGYVIDKVLG